MEVEEPSLPNNPVQGGEQEEGRSALTAQKANSLHVTSVLTKEQLETVEAVFSKGSQAPLDAIDVDTATKLLVDLRPDVSQEQIDELMERFDIGFQGYLEKAQVLEAAEAVCGYELEKAQMYKAFRLFDRDDNGFLSPDQLKAALQEGDDGLSNDELATFLRLSACKTETCFDYRKFIDQVAYAPVVVSAAAKKKKTKGKKR